MDNGRDHSGEIHLAAYATRAAVGGHRRYCEPADSLRCPFAVDRHRIIESAAFRRLQRKTQVFVATDYDHFRTRMTHTLEVADTARCLAVRIRANETLAEAICLAHDLGHPPFGHAGEAALDQVMAGHGGFNHNAHSLRVVEYLEHPFPYFRGLNLTRATLTGLHWHQTRYDRPSVDAELVTHGGARVLTPDEIPSVESQIASLADRIAYNCHDLEDAMGAGFVTREDLSDVALWRDAASAGNVDGADINIAAVRRTILNGIIRLVLTDVISTFEMCLEKQEPLWVALSTAMESSFKQMEEFLIERVYHQPEIARMDERGRKTVLALFDAYRSCPNKLPQRYAIRIGDQSPERVICDYIAGMTDRFCLQERDRLAAPL